MKVRTNKIYDTISKRYLTEGREYDVLWHKKSIFVIRNDKNRKILCLFKNCSHTKNNWEIIP